MMKKNLKLFLTITIFKPSALMVKIKSLGADQQTMRKGKERKERAGRRRILKRKKESFITLSALKSPPLGTFGWYHARYKAFWSVNEN